MKKTLCLAVALLTLCFAAPAQNHHKSSTIMKSSSSRALVAYFSASGVTQKVAQQLAEAAHADLFEIRPEKPYSTSDLDWTNKKSRSSIEMQDKTSRPAIAATVKDIEAYDVIYIGFPIWWYTAPTIINTFIESHRLEGKRLIPFATSGGSSIDKACQDLRQAYPQLQWEPGKLLNRPSSAELEEMVR
ncbi:MAG: NAD(P)H-dependent oxidoreductase [Bacteroidales bacterium]|nr:NAD(P)H-dependent oxidoreductase [Bacteroidales bacterium]